jgi:hypothetical protein
VGSSVYGNEFVGLKLQENVLKSRGTISLARGIVFCGFRRFIDVYR